MADPYLSGYTKRYKITIPFAEVTGDETDFPFLVHLEGSADGGSENFDFTLSNADGFDVRFTLADGETLLNFERERHDDTDERADYHVSIDDVDADDPGTYFYLYQRSADTADGADPTAVWDANFVAVYHMSDPDSGTLIDDSTEQNDGTKKANAEPSVTAGQIHYCQDFDGVDDYITLTQALADLLESKSTGWTIEILMKGGASTEVDFFFSCRDQTSDDEVRFNTEIDAPLLKAIYDDDTFGGLATEFALDTSVDFNAIAVTITASVLSLYVAGSSQDTIDVSGVENLVNLQPPTLGERLTGTIHYTPGHASYYAGLIDEVRFSNTTRSSTWVNLTYRSGKQDILTFGSIEILAPTGFAHSQGIMI